MGILLLDLETEVTVWERAGDVFGEDNVGDPLVGNGHAAAVTALAYSPDGRVLLSAGADATARLWDVNSGKHLRCFELDASPYHPIGYDIAFGPAGRTVAATMESALSFWDATDGSHLDRWEAPQTVTVDAFSGVVSMQQTSFNSLHYSDDGQTILAGLADHTARLYDAGSGILIGLMRHTGPVRSAALGPDSARIIAALGNSGSKDDSSYEAWIWDGAHPDIALAAAVQNLVEEGVALAEGDDTGGALAHFERAQALNPFPDYDLAQEGRSRAIIQLHESIRERATDGEIDAALVGLRSISQIDPDAALEPATLNAVCRYGSLWHQAATVLSLCDRAVAGVSFVHLRAYYQDSRAITRALTGDYQGAIEDFAAYVAYYEDSRTMADEVAQRQEWIAALQADRNPFDEATLEALREE